MATTDPGNPHDRPAPSQTEKESVSATLSAAANPNGVADPNGAAAATPEPDWAEAADWTAERTVVRGAQPGNRLRPAMPAAEQQAPRPRFLAPPLSASGLGAYARSTPVTPTPSPPIARVLESGPRAEQAATPQAAEGGAYAGAAATAARLRRVRIGFVLSLSCTVIGLWAVALLALS